MSFRYRFLSVIVNDAMTIEPWLQAGERGGCIEGPRCLVVHKCKLFPASFASMTRNPNCCGKLVCCDTESTDEKVESAC